MPLMVVHLIGLDGTTDMLQWPTAEIKPYVSIGLIEMELSQFM